MKLVHDPRSDSAHIDEDKVEPIMLFIKEVSEGKGIYYAVEEDAYNDEQLKAVEKVFRVSHLTPPNPFPSSQPYPEFTFAKQKSHNR